MKLEASLCALALAAWPTAALALDPPQKCQSSKLGSAGKYGFCRLKAEAKAVKAGGLPDYTKCDDSFSLKWSKAESTAGIGVCPSEGDESALQAFIAQHTDDVAAALAGGPLPNCNADLATCNSELAEATACGNGAIDGSEDCDFDNLDGQTCVTLGYAGGTLLCSSGCAFDTSDCYAARFVDNADGTITDNETDLMWEKKASLDGASNPPDPHDAENSYPWSGTCTSNPSKYCQGLTAASTLCTANAENGTTGCEECTGGDGVCSVTDTVWSVVQTLNTGVFAGHSDWRIPTRAELQGMLDYSDPVLAVDTAFYTAGCFSGCTDVTDPACSCPLLDSGNWSATAWALNSDNAWAVSEGAGDMAFLDRTLLFQVRAVRSVP